MISTSIINVIGIIILIYSVPTKYIPEAVIIIALLGLGAGIWEIAVSYRDKEEKTRDITVVAAIAVMQGIMAKTAIEPYLKQASLNTNNTIMKELVTSMLHAPAGTEFIYQILMFIGIVVIVASAAGAIMRR